MGARRVKWRGVFKRYRNCAPGGKLEDRTERRRRLELGRQVGGPGSGVGVGMLRRQDLEEVVS